MANPTVAQVTAAVVTSPAVHSFSEAVGAHYMPVRVFMHFIEGLHVAGLPYCAGIIAMTISLRLMLAPLLVYSAKIGTKMVLLKPEMEELAAEYNRQKALGTGDQKAAAAEYSQKLIGVYRKHGCSPLSPMMMPLVSGPMFFSCFFALHGFCTDGIIGMNTGGAFWFQDLTLPDPYFILPLVSSWTGVLIIKRGSESGGVIDPKMKPFLTAFAVVGLASPLFTYSLPAGVTLYFTAMSTISLIQGEIMRSDVSRRAMGLPTLSEMRIQQAVKGSYTPFVQSDPKLQKSLGGLSQAPAGKTADEDAKDKKARKRPLDFKKR